MVVSGQRQHGAAEKRLTASEVIVADRHPGRHERWHQLAAWRPTSRAHRPTSRAPRRRASRCARRGTARAPRRRRVAAPPTRRRRTGSSRRATGRLVTQQPAVLGERELAPQRLSGDATEGLGPDGRGEVGHLVAVAVVVPGDDGGQRALARVGEHPGLAHAGDADRPHGHAGGFRRGAQRIEGTAAQCLRVDLSAVRADVPRRGGTTGSRARCHRRRRPRPCSTSCRRRDRRMPSSRSRPLPTWVSMDMVAFDWICRQAPKERHATGRHGRTRRSRRQAR